jgi:hypothetical protein
MAGQCCMAILAGIVNAAAFHFDCDDIKLAPVMGAASLRIQIDSANFRARQLVQGLHR